MPYLKLSAIKLNQLTPFFVAFVLLGRASLALGGDGTEASDRPSARQPSPPDFLPSKPPPEFSLPPVPFPSETTRAGRLFKIEAYAFAGNTVFENEQLQTIAAPFVGKLVGIADLEELRQRLTRYYVDHGYVNSGVVVPQNPLRDGVFHFQIREGKLDEIRLKGQGRLRDGYIKNRLSPDRDEPFNIQHFQEKFELLLTDPLIDKINGRLLPGTEPGQNILDLDVTRARPYQFSLFGNNYRSPSIGAEAGGAEGWVQNLTGLGDLLNLSVAVSEGATRYSGLWRVPLSDYGTQAYFRFDEGDSSVVEEPLNEIDIGSKIHNLEGGISHPLINALQRRLVLGAAFAVRENETSLLGEPFSFVRGLDSGRNQTTVLRFSQDYIERWERQALAFRSTFSLGLNALDSTTEQNKNNPDSEFFAWLGQIQYIQRIFGNGARLVFRGDLQLSNEPLLPLEQVAVGGVGSVRGYRENQLVRDEGYSGSIEFRYPVIGVNSGSRHRLDLVTFMDYGEAWNHGDKSDYLHSVGVGFNWTFPHFSTDFYWAQAIKDPPRKSNDDLQDHGIHFQVKLDAF